MKMDVRRWLALGTALIATSALTVACTSAASPAATVKVDRGPVRTSVSASGSLVAITEQNLGFPNGGTIAALPVKVGDHVAAGQVLAKLDDFALRQALTQKQAALTQQQATLRKTQGDPTVDGAHDTLAQAQDILAATKQQVDATAAADQTSVKQAKKQLDFDTDALDSAQDELATAQASCASQQYSVLGVMTGAATTCQQQVATAQSSVQTAQRTRLSSETAYKAAKRQADVDAASGHLSIENAEQSVVNARNSLDSAGNSRGPDIDAQSAMVRDAQAAVALAQRDVDEATLTAPVAGVVSAINGSVGETVGQASGTTALAPGSSARLPMTSMTGSEGGTGAAAAAAGPFITLSDVASFQLVVPFEEADAAQVAAGQSVDVTVDAVPGLTVPAKVLAVSPSGTSSSGIVNYYATLVLSGSDPRLRDGQTAEAAVVVDQAENVLRVPSSVVRTEGGRSVVSIPGPDGSPQTVPFTPGEVGDQFTEVKAGLAEGQAVIAPQATVSAAPDRPTGSGGD